MNDDIAVTVKVGDSSGVNNFNLFSVPGQGAPKAGGDSHWQEPHRYVLWTRAKTRVRIVRSCRCGDRACLYLTFWYFLHHTFLGLNFEFSKNSALLYYVS